MYALFFVRRHGMWHRIDEDQYKRWTNRMEMFPHVYSGTVLLKFGE